LKTYKSSRQKWLWQSYWTWK